jgi:hypothetical protein
MQEAGKRAYERASENLFQAYEDAVVADLVENDRGVLEDDPTLLDVIAMILVAMAKNAIRSEKRLKNECLCPEFDQIEGNALRQERSDISKRNRRDDFDDKLM